MQQEEDKIDILPERSGSAPPCIDASLLSFTGFLFQKISLTNSGLEKWRSEYANFENTATKLNPRLPPPLMSKENRRLVHRMINKLRVPKLPSSKSNGDDNPESDNHQKLDDSQPQSQLLSDVNEKTLSFSAPSYLNYGAMQMLYPFYYAYAPPLSYPQFYFPFHYVSASTSSPIPQTQEHVLLETVKCNGNKNIKIKDIIGHVVSFSMDQHGSRFIQRKLEHCSEQEKVLIFNEVLPYASHLMGDAFGNYVIQKLLQRGNPEQKRCLSEACKGKMVYMSLHTYGCRVVQKVIEVLELREKKLLLQELNGHVMMCVHDHNGNHVIQKCIQCLLAEDIKFIISSFKGSVVSLSMHRYGCRAMQRVLENCLEEARDHTLVDEILANSDVLSKDQYGNYVVQHLLKRGRPEERRRIIDRLSGNIVQLINHKFASNIVEMCLELGKECEVEILIREINGKVKDDDQLLMLMMKNKYGNYVIQKILETGNDEIRTIILKYARSHLHELERCTYSKHIVSKLEQL